MTHIRLTARNGSGTLPRLNLIFYCGAWAGNRALAVSRHITHAMAPSSIERIGIDESGKGDYFGPLVIAAVFVDETTQNELALMAVRDSKKISDGRILELAPDIRTICPHSVIAIGPQKYNELYAKIKNLNRLLAWGHAKALETLLERVP